MSTAIVLFRRELRFFDNTALHVAVSSGMKIIPMFIFTPEQVSDKNLYKSNHAVRFMVESLLELDSQHPLWCFYGEQHTTIDKLLSSEKITTVYAARDYTRYAIQRDKQIKSVCENHGVEFVQVEDVLLNPIGSVLTQNGEYYQKYTPYKTAVLQTLPAHGFELTPEPAATKFIKPPAAHTLKKILTKYKKFVLPTFKFTVPEEFRGGRAMGLIKLKHSLKSVVKDYSKHRDNLADPNSTSRLSPYIKFGCLSVREVYNSWYNTPGGTGLVAQLIWRDFYYNIGYGYPHIYENLSLKPQYDTIKWQGDKKWLERWKTGTTGFPVVDAGMRELIETGYMHNRARLITSGFLIKILLIDWREGEKWYSQNLVDIDRAVNNGNWQWSSSSGADSQPYFRILNPWRQSAKFDPEAVYIKHWVPELEQVPAADIHNWEEHEVQKRWAGMVNYPAPMVHYKTQRALALKMYKQKS